MYEKRKSGVQASLDFLFYARRTSNSHHKRYSYSLLGPGTLTAHRRFHLVLLHSCPDTVHRFLLRKTQTSTPLFRGSPTVKTPSVGQHPCYSGLQVQGTAISPTSAALLCAEVQNKLDCILLYFPQNGNLFFQIWPLLIDIFKIGLYIF